MNAPWVSLILLGIAASFLPLQFGLEIALLGKSDGLKKSFSLISGITLFRILILVAIGLVFTGLLELISTFLADISTAVSTTLHQLHLAVTSGQHVIFDGLLIAAGVMLCFRAYNHWRNRTQTEDAKESHPSFSERFGESPGGLLALGLVWAAVSLNQWLFTPAALGEILSLSDHATRLLATLLFLIMASLMVLLPIMLYLIGPGKAQSVLGKVDNWLSEAMPIVVIVILFAIGLYFILDGIVGVMNFSAGQQRLLSPI